MVDLQISLKQWIIDIYQDLTTSALASYVVGDRTKAAEAMIADLAVIQL